MTMSDDSLLVERRGSHLWLTLNRPGKANAMTVDVMERLTAQLVKVDGESDVAAVLLTGAGERVFSAGVDVREASPDGDIGRHRARRSHALAALQDAVLDTPKPVIVVLNGAAIGGGAMLALLADACVAADGAELGLPEIDISIPTFSGVNILEVIGGRALALDLIQSGRRMPAHEAATRGLLRAVTPRSELVAIATAQADALGSKDRAAFSANKRWINRSLKAALAEARGEHARHRAQAAGTT